MKTNITRLIVCPIAGCDSVGRQFVRPVRPASSSDRPPAQPAITSSDHIRPICASIFMFIFANAATNRSGRMLVKEAQKAL